MPVSDEARPVPTPGPFGSLEIPVVAAPMAGASGPQLATAVSRAGGLGTLGFGSAVTPMQIAEAAAAVPHGVRFGVGLMGWAVEDRPELIDAAVASGATFVSVSFGIGARAVDRLTSNGVTVVTQVGTAEETREALDLGVDVLVARGSEGGGHGRGEVACLPLLQQVLEVVDGTVPVLAGGGIGTGRGVAAVLAAGADAAWVGTVFAACRESQMPAAFRRAICMADTVDTVYTRAFDVGQRVAWPTRFGGRALRNAFTDEWAERVDALQQAVDSDETITESLVRARTELDPTRAPIYAGQAAGLLGGLTPEPTTAEVMAELATFRRHLSGAARRWS